MKNFSNILKVSFLIIAFAISLAILSACNSNPIPSEHFNGNCITKGFTRYYMPNGGYIDRKDKDTTPIRTKRLLANSPVRRTELLNTPASSARKNASKRP